MRAQRIHVIVSLAAAFALAACSGGAQPTASPSQTAAPTATPSPTVATVVPEPTAPEGRNPDMDATEAEVRASQATTGETWLTDASAIDTPAWSVEDVFWNTWDGVGTWHRIGSRAGADILRHDGSGEIVEVAADGTPTWIPFPYPWQEVTALDWSPEIESDDTVYYDSLATAANVDLDGLVLSMRGPYVPLVGSWSTAEIATVNLWAVDRFTQDVQGGWGDDPAWVAYDEGLENVAFGRRSPVGDVYDAPPTRPAWDDVVWENGFGTVEGRFIDLFDQACGPVQTLTWNILLTEPDMADWEVAGSVDGFPVYAMDESSDLATLMHDHYVQNPVGIRLEPDARDLSLADYATAPAVLGVPAGDGSGWWLLLNQSVSLRAWC